MAAEPEEIPFILQEYADDTRAIIDQITQMAFYLRGGYTREDLWALSPKERKAALKLIEENIDRTNKSGITLC